MPGWTFITNHALVLLTIAAEPGSTTRTIAAQVGITERAVQRILDDLETEGYIERTRIGRRNQYKVFPDQPLRHPSQQGIKIRQLLEVLEAPGAANKPA